MSTTIPTAEEIFARYLSENATDKKGYKYVFAHDSEHGGEAPDHFRLAECVFVDNGIDSQADADVSAEVHERCDDAEVLWIAEHE